MVASGCLDRPGTTRASATELRDRNHGIWWWTPEIVTGNAAVVLLDKVGIPGLGTGSPRVWQPSLFSVGYMHQTKDTQIYYSQVVQSPWWVVLVYATVGRTLPLHAFNRQLILISKFFDYDAPNH